MTNYAITIVPLVDYARNDIGSYMVALNNKTLLVDINKYEKSNYGYEKFR